MRATSVLSAAIFTVVLMSSPAQANTQHFLDIDSSPSTVEFENMLPGVPKSQVVLLDNNGTLDAQIKPIFNEALQSNDIDVVVTACTGSWTEMGTAPVCSGEVQKSDFLSAAGQTLELLVTATLNRDLTTDDASASTWSGQISFEGIEAVALPPSDLTDIDQDASPLFPISSTSDLLPRTGAEVGVTALLAIGLIVLGGILRKKGRKNR